MRYNMRYELTNRYYGIKKIAPSEKAKDEILAQSKIDPKDNKPVWVVSKELPDEGVALSAEQQLLDRIAELEAELEDKPKGEVKAAPKKKAAKKVDNG
jgi:hypothetical protein